MALLAGVGAAGLPYQSSVSLIHGSGHNPADENLRKLMADDGRPGMAQLRWREMHGFIELSNAAGISADRNWYYAAYTVNNLSDRPYCVAARGGLYPTASDSNASIGWTYSWFERDKGKALFLPARGFTTMFFGRLDVRERMRRTARDRLPLNLRDQIQILAWPQNSGPGAKCLPAPKDVTQWRSYVQPGHMIYLPQTPQTQ